MKDFMSLFVYYVGPSYNFDAVLAIISMAGK
jgi:hypothetical protein